MRKEVFQVLKKRPGGILCLRTSVYFSSLFATQVLQENVENNNHHKYTTDNTNTLQMVVKAMSFCFFESGLEKYVLKHSLVSIYSALK